MLDLAVGKMHSERVMLIVTHRPDYSPFWRAQAAFTQLNLTLSTGVYGATFFLLTGLHGIHVAIGAVFLAIVLARTLGGQITQDRHFAFTAGSWYWHFVGVAWVVLFILVYCI